MHQLVLSVGRFSCSADCLKGAAKMHTIVLATQKGGSGKSTIAIGLAVAAIEDGQNVAMIEADPQGTVSKWARRRTKLKPRIDRVGSGIEIKEALAFLKRESFTLAIIDTAGTNNNLSREALSVADLCLIPARPSVADIEAALPTLAVIRKLDRQFAFILNQTPARSHRLSEAAAVLSELGVLALPYVVLRNDHQDAMKAGLSVTEFAPDGKAAEEIRHLWRWVCKRLDEKSLDCEGTAIRATA
jgi:chromosome partitioning protein